MTARLMPDANFPSMAGVPIARPRLAIPGRQATSDVLNAADEAVTRLYDEQARPLLGIAALLVWLAVSSTGSAPGAGLEAGESPAIARGLETVSTIAEEIVHDSFAAVHREWRRLRDADRAVTHLRRCTVQGTRRFRDRKSGGTAPPASLPDGVTVPSTRVLSALRGLPCWQREALVLRYYADLPEAQAAAAMGVTRAAFRGHATRGMTSLRRLLDQGHS
jgi:DNA-directed RNA polymerase specialized sigma24 family protein